MVAIMKAELRQGNAFRKVYYVIYVHNNCLNEQKTFILHGKVECTYLTGRPNLRISS